MIKTAEQMTRVMNQRMRGGEGEVEMVHLLNPEEFTGKARLCARLTLQQGCSIGFHQHDQEEEIYYILSGEGVFTENGQETVIGPGTASLTGNGNGHSIRNEKPEPLVILAVILLFA